MDYREVLDQYKDNKNARRIMNSVKDGMHPFRPGPIFLEILDDRYPFENYILEVRMPLFDLTFKYHVDQGDFNHYGNPMSGWWDLGARIRRDIRHRVMTEREPNLSLGEN